MSLTPPALANLSLEKKHHLFEWAIKCYSGKSHVNDYLAELTYLLESREQMQLNMQEMIRTLKTLKPSMDPETHLVEAFCEVLTRSENKHEAGIKQITVLMDKYSKRVNETEKRKKLDFFPRLSLFLKKALGVIKEEEEKDSTGLDHVVENMAQGIEEAIDKEILEHVLSVETTPPDKEISLDQDLDDLAAFKKRLGLI